MSSSIEPPALAPRDAAAFLSISKRSLSRLIRDGKIEARKHGPRTLVGVGSLKAYYAALPTKADHAPILFGAPCERNKWEVAMIDQGVIFDGFYFLTNAHRNRYINVGSAAAGSPRVPEARCKRSGPRHEHYSCRTFRGLNCA